MKLNEHERDLFADFGEPRVTDIDLSQEAHAVAGSPIEGVASNENHAPAPVKTPEKATGFEAFTVAHDANDAKAAFNVLLDPPERAEDIEIMPVETPAKEFKTGFSWAAFTGGAAAFLWVGGAIGGPFAYFGTEAVMAMEPTLQAGLIALAFGPAMLFWLGGVAAGEAYRARKLAAEATRLAQSALNPFDKGEQQAKRFTKVVKDEIEGLNEAVTAALVRLGDFKTAAKQHAQIFDDAVATSREHADHLAENLSRERDALQELNGDLRGQTETMAHSIGRQVRLMREASKMVKSELGAAEQTLSSHLSQFGDAADTMAVQTASLNDAALRAHEAQGALGSTLDGMLDGLTQASQLTDAARHSAETAVLAANDAAGAVRETMDQATSDAAQAAQMIRAEAQAMRDTADETLSRLQMAADAARAASDESQAAADRHAASIERRLSALAATATAPKKPAAPRAQRPVTPAYTSSLNAAASEAAARETHAYSAPRHDAVRHEPVRQDHVQQQRGFDAFGRWNKPQAPVQPAAADDLDLLRFEEAPRDPDAQLKSSVLGLMSAAGVDMDTVFTSIELDHIAQRSRHGAVARREAVVDYAPVAVNRILRQMKRDPAANDIAEAFRARPDLATNKTSGSSELVRAYLLIDAALD